MQLQSSEFLSANDEKNVRSFLAGQISLVSLVTYSFVTFGNHRTDIFGNLFRIPTRHQICFLMTLTQLILTQVTVHVARPELNFLLTESTLTTNLSQKRLMVGSSFLARRHQKLSTG